MTYALHTKRQQLLIYISTMLNYLITTVTYFLHTYSINYHINMECWIK